MTDQQMHERLQQAGARFRERTATTTSSVELDEMLPDGGRRWTRVLVAVAAVAVVLLVVGLAMGLRGSQRPAPPSTDHAGLIGNVWLVSPNVRPSTAALYISPSGHLVADDECRVMGGKASVSGDRLTITDVIVRLKPCTDQYGAGFYDQGTRVLRGSSTFRISDGGLTISRSGVGSLHFALARSAVPPPSLDVPTLTGADWVATNGTVLHIDPATGRLSGGWCGGRAVVTGPDVRFDSCAAAGTGNYAAAVAGTTLTLTDGTAHHRTLAFRWRPTDAAIIDPRSLVDRSWQLESVAGLPASSGTLRIADGTAIVADGCGIYRRSIRVSAGTFSIAGRVPRPRCNEEALTADSFVFDHPAAWTVRAGKLIVYGGGSQTLAVVFGSTAPAAPQPDPALLLGHPWRVATIRFGSGAYARGAPTADPATLTFTGSGYRLEHTCYYQDGLAARGPQTIMFRTGRLTDHSCPRPANYAADKQAARAIDAILAGAVQWSINGGELTLKGHEGTLVLQPDGPVSAALMGRWTLRSIVPNDGPTTPALPTPRVSFVFSAHEATAQGTKATTLTYTGNQVRFDQPWTDNLTLGRGPGLSVTDERFVFGTLLQGVVSYHVLGGSLTITKAGVGQANFTRQP